MSDRSRLSGDWTPRRQAMAYQQVLDSIEKARRSVVEFAGSGYCARTKALQAAADAMDDRRDELIAANQADLRDARDGGMSPGGLARLELTEQRLGQLAQSVRATAELPSPISEELPAQPGTVRVPLGVVGVIYEAQPATTVLASAPLLKAGNAVLLRGAAAAERTDTALVEILHAGLVEAGAAVDSVQALPIAERSTIRYLVSAHGLVDLVVLRAGVSLARRARGDAAVPLLELGHGICHVYLDASADAAIAQRVLHDSTLTHPARTGATHTVLVHRQAASRLLPAVLERLTRAGATIHGDDHVLGIAPSAVPATDDDWRDEYLTGDLAVRVVDSLDEAVQHIAHHGTGHTETIITEDPAAGHAFAAAVNAATIAINTATDAPELFITQRAHTRGPLRPEVFTSTKHLSWPA